MSDFQLYFQLGLNHILSLSSWDHILFLVSLVVIFDIERIKSVLWIISLFSIAHTTSLFLSAFNYIIVDNEIVEKLIILTIIITALSNIIIGNTSLQHKTHYYFSLFFGIIHGLGFAKDFKMLISGQKNVTLPLLDFTLGIETAQIIISVFILIFMFLFTKLFNIKKNFIIKIISYTIIFCSLMFIL